MKKQLLIITAALIIFCYQFTNAQNANRSGLFTEMGIGLVTGDRPVTDLEERSDITESGTVSQWGDGMVDQLDISVVRKKKAFYGAGINLAIGYRIATSNHFAIDFKAKCQNATYRFTKTLLCSLCFGVRYISAEFAGNKSLYANIATGCGLFIGESKFAVPYELGIGINFSNRFYSGISWDAQYSTADKWIYGKHYGSVGLKFGFRI